MTHTHIRTHAISLFMALVVALPMGAATYYINSLAELEDLATDIVANNGYAGDEIQLEANIALPANHVWTAIGTTATPFQGHFDGKNHLISGLGQINGDGGYGLFGVIGANGKVENLGISEGTIVTMGNGVGPLAGVCAGTIENCWSMAQITLAGNIVGGLIGQLESGGTLKDVYSVGPILSAQSITVGALVGTNNGGSITRAYTNGYAKNGNGFVGQDNNGTYTECYYDRKLYMLEPGAATITPVDNTTHLFSLFTDARWAHTPNHYPQLKTFESTDASLLSVTPLFVDSTHEDHANKNLEHDLTLEISNGVLWVCQKEEDTIYIQIKDDKATISRPCTDRDMLIDAKLNGFIHTFYLLPKPVDDLKINAFSTTSQEACFEDNLPQPSMPSVLDGTPTYHRRITLDSLDATTQAIQKTITLADDDDATYPTFDDWQAIDTLPTNKEGLFALHFYAHDEGCFTVWKECPNTFQYTVYPKVVPGQIIDGTNRVDTIFVGDTITLTGTPTTGGKPAISYQWYCNDNAIADSVGLHLIGHQLTDTGTFVFTRSSADALCYPLDAHDTDAGSATIKVIYPFDAGAVTKEEKQIFCSLEDAQAWIITDTLASGGVEEFGYSYQWYHAVGTDTTKIAGATEHSIQLADVNLETDQTYTFFRKARNNWWRCDTAESRWSQEIQILQPYQAGTVPNHTDTIYAGDTISIMGLPSTGGLAPYSYQWYSNDAAITDSTNQTLVQHVLNDLGEFIFTRASKDAQCTPTLLPDEGADTILVIVPFDPGAVTKAEKQVFCTIDEAKAITITDTLATGAVTANAYSYQWYQVIGIDTTQISGATGHNLVLSSVDLEAGKTYTFFRKARNNWWKCPWTESRWNQEIQILAAINPGEVETKAYGLQCTDATTFDISIAEVTPASGGEVALSYEWRYELDGAETVIATTDALAYTLTLDEANAGKTYTFRRYVRQGTCEWQASAGQVTFEFGHEEHHTRSFTICADKLPYTLTRTREDGTSDSHTFTADNETWVFITQNSAGCQSDTTFTCHVKPVPQVTIAPPATICQENNQMPVEFEVVSGNADYFHITYGNELAALLGKTDTAGFITDEGTITILSVPVLSEATYSMEIIFSDSESGDTPADYCYTAPQTVTFNAQISGYVHTKFDRILFVDNNPENGEQPAPKLSFKAYQWFKDGVLQEGQIGQYYHEDGALLNGSYYVLLTDTAGHTYRSCPVVMTPSTASGAAPATVYPVPANTGEVITVVCNNADVTLLSTSGERVLTRTDVTIQTQFNAPPIPGFYVIQIAHKDGRVETHKLIVK